MASPPSSALVRYNGNPRLSFNILRYIINPLSVLRNLRIGISKRIIGEPDTTFHRYTCAERPDLANPCYPITGTPIGTKRRRALLIACSYKGAPAIPDGPPDANGRQPMWNPYLPNSTIDAMKLKDLLQKNFGWAQDEITVLSDEPFTPEDLVPTKANIIRHMNLLVQDAQAEDLLFFHFSGHGTQFPIEDSDGGTGDHFETDRCDECVYPSDYHILQAQLPPGSNPRDAFILDNQLRECIVDRLPTGCRCIALVDCCHSGTMFDLPYSQDCTLSRNSSAKASSTRTHNSSFSSSGASTPAPLTPVEARSNVNLGMPHRKSVVGNGGRPYMPVKKSHTMPPFVNKGWMEIRARAVPIFLTPLRQRSGPNAWKDGEKSMKRLIDDRIILGDMLCISSCQDAGMTYEGGEGGMLIQAFCEIIRRHQLGQEELTIANLVDDIGIKLDRKYEDMVAGGYIKRSEHPKPCPQLSFSRNLYLDTSFSLAL